MKKDVFNLKELEKEEKMKWTEVALAQLAGGYHSITNRKEKGREEARKHG